ncbi:MAG: hypothetical protein II304_15145 [Bacteroidales bacterium]|jgi:hypothetical protein|nr:hypothetical protein [Bacteroidales bacterium]
MDKMTTREIFDAYFESTFGAKDARQRGLLKEDIIYSYEQEIGKSLFEMNIDEIFNMLDLYNVKKNGEKVDFISNYSIDQLLTLFRKIFDYYIDVVLADEVLVIRNPFKSDKMKGKELDKRLSKDKEPITWETVEDIIRKLHKDLPQDRADYIELVMLLFYNGFETAEEIVTTTEDKIDHNRMAVFLPGRTVQLSERCYSLFTKFNNMTEMEGWRNFVLVSWNNSYFKFIVRANKAGTVNDRPKEYMNNTINVLLAQYVNDKYQTKLNYRNLYLLGFYDYLVKKFGIEYTTKMFNSYRDFDDAHNLMAAAREYGFKVNNISHFKRRLRPFIKYE